MKRPAERLATISLRLLDHLDKLEKGEQRGAQTFRQTTRQIARARDFFPAENTLAHRMLRLHEQRNRYLRVQTSGRGRIRKKPIEPITLTVLEPAVIVTPHISIFSRGLSAILRWLMHPLLVVGSGTGKRKEASDTLLSKAA